MVMFVFRGNCLSIIMSSIIFTGQRPYRSSIFYFLTESTTLRVDVRFFSVMCDSRKIQKFPFSINCINRVHVGTFLRILKRCIKFYLCFCGGNYSLTSVSRSQRSKKFELSEGSRFEVDERWYINAFLDACIYILILYMPTCTCL